MSEIFIECAMKKPENPYVFVADALYRFYKKCHFNQIFENILLLRRANEGVNVVDVGSTTVEDCFTPNEK